MSTPCDRARCPRRCQREPQVDPVDLCQRGRFGVLAGCATPSQGAEAERLVGDEAQATVLLAATIAATAMAEAATAETRGRVALAQAVPRQAETAAGSATRQRLRGTGTPAAARAGREPYEPTSDEREQPARAEGQADEAQRPVPHALAGDAERPSAETATAGPA